MSAAPESYNYIAGNIRFCMDEQHISRRKLAADLYVPYTTVCDWLNHKTTPRAEMLEKIAKYFNISVGDLFTLPPDTTDQIIKELGFDVNVSVKGTDPEPRKIDVLGSLNHSNVIGTVYILSDEYPDVSNLKIIGLKIRGDSMAPRFCDNDTVIVIETLNWQEELRTGDIVIATVNGDVVCKKLQNDEDGVTLIPTNEKYKPMHYTAQDLDSGNVTIYGKVVEVREKVINLCDIFARKQERSIKINGKHKAVL